MAGPFCDDFADAAWAEGTALTYAALKAAGHDEFMAGAIRRQTVEKADWFAAFVMDLPGKMCPVDGLINTPRGAHAIRFKGEPDVQIVLRGLLITFAMDECLPAVSLGRLKRQIEAAAVRSRRRQTSVMRTGGSDE